MQYLVYHKLDGPQRSEQLISCLQPVADDLYACRELITIDAAATLTLSAMTDILHDFMAQYPLGDDDILYLFYPDAGGRIALWPFKKQGSARLRKRDAAIRIHPEEAGILRP